MNIEQLKSAQEEYFEPSQCMVQMVSLPRITEENTAQYEEWLGITEELGIGFGKYGR